MATPSTTTIPAPVAGTSTYNTFNVDPNTGIAANVVPKGGLGATVITSEGDSNTYRAAILGVTPVATPTDVLQMIGSATATIRVKRVAITGVATAAGQMPAQLVRRSAPGTQGSATVTAISPGKHDSTDATATASIGYVQTANWTTVGTSAGVLGAGRFSMGAVGTGTSTILVWNFCISQDKPIILRGTSEYLYINLNGAAVPSGGLLDFEIEWEEDNS